MLEKQASSLGEVFALVRDIARSWSSSPAEPLELWFRGQLEPLELLPGLYRPVNACFHYREESLFERFKAMATPFCDGQVRNDWDWYYLAQHHGLPTRLLDWTQNLLAAVYFALAKHFETGDRRSYDVQLRAVPAAAIFDDKSPVILVLEAGSLNAHSCGPDDDCVITPGGEFTARYLPTGDFSKVDENRCPIAILPPYSNSRILAQQGVFTVHGHDPRSLEQIAETDGRGRVKLGRITLDRARLAQFWEDLEYAGINRSALFPDLDSVAYCVKWDSQQV